MACIVLALKYGKCGYPCYTKLGIWRFLQVLAGRSLLTPGLAKANGMRWYEHVLRKDNDEVLRLAFD